MSKEATTITQWSIEPKTLAWFVAAASVLLLVLVGAFVTARSLMNSALEVRRSMLVMAGYDRLMEEYNHVISSQRAYLETGNRWHLNEQLHAQEQLQQQLALLRERIPPQEVAKRRSLDSLSGLIDADISRLVTAEIKPPVDAAAPGQELSAPSQERIAQVRNGIEAARTAADINHQRHLQGATARIRWLYVFVTFSAITLVSALGWLLWRLGRDLKARREVENDLEQATHFQESLLDNIPALIFAKDAKDLRFVRLNRHGAELLGYPSEQMLGKTDFDFFPPEQARAFIAKDREVLAQGGIVDIPDEELDTVSRGRRTLHTYKVPVFDTTGQPILLLGISLDITEQKANERRIVALNEELTRQTRLLQSSNEELESFSYSVSHDLRAPLRAINGYARLLEQNYGPKFDAEGLRYLRTICNACNRMSQLIDDLLDFSRIGSQALKEQWVDMEALVQRVIGEALAGRPQPAPSIQTQELPQALGDRNLLHLVWLNLIDNAIKYSSAVATPRITIGADSNDQEFIYFVSDNGIGFDTQYADQLFGVFQRLHADPQYPGTGVGLAIAQRIVARHGGRIWADSQPGRGARFSFSLPRAAQAQPPVTES